MPELRITEVSIGGKWVKRNMVSIGVGDIIRVTNPDGTPVLVGGCRTLRAVSNGHINKDGVAAVEVDAYHDNKNRD